MDQVHTPYDSQPNNHRIHEMPQLRTLSVPMEWDCWDLGRMSDSVLTYQGSGLRWWLATTNQQQWKYNQQCPKNWWLPGFIATHHSKVTSKICWYFRTTMDTDEPSRTTAGQGSFRSHGAEWWDAVQAARRWGHGIAGALWSPSVSS